MHAVSCDGCGRWQHRKCDTGITSEQYRLMSSEQLTMEWSCVDCNLDSEVRQLSSTTVCDEIPPDTSIPNSPIRELSQTYTVRSDGDLDVVEPEEDRMEEASNTIDDRSYDISNRNIERPHVLLDESLPDRPLDDVIPNAVPKTYEVVESGSKRGGRLLVSSDGYTYNARKTQSGRTYWTCSVRNKQVTCFASVKQFGDMFTASLNGHTHPADPGAYKKI
ncbi:hypothetical protein DPMN_103532 [Dreissena polymorpha]|uniref:FLYWCH-type domain-containing protein n=1 Tax=Dreissena polymorpha TaxID=45954 RepID=A0A9D4H8M5_DREPO|nr:hypothetical protein DPMN_103532 [Dreissena polymorpha]